MQEERYFTSLAAAFVRGRLGAVASEDDGAAITRGLAAGLRLHKFKRNADLPRVRRVLGVLRGLAPHTLLDVGSGRGTFLWPLLDAFPDLTVTAIDVDERRAVDLQAVTLGGVARLLATHMDATRLTFGDRSFDVVTLLEVLEHMPEPDRALRHALRVAKRSVIASVPSKEDENPEHIQLWDARTFRALFERCGAAGVQIDFVRGHMLAIAAAAS